MQIEKEDVIKGDVQGTIKYLMKKKEQSGHKSKMNPHKKAKVPFKNTVPPQQAACECPTGPKTEEKPTNPPPVRNMQAEQHTKDI